MMRRRLLQLGVAVALTMSVATCRDSPSGASAPLEGWLSLDLVTPNGDDGGIMLVIAGGVVDSVRSVHPHVISRAESATATRVVIGGNIEGGQIAEVWVPDTRKVAQYSASAVEVASRISFSQRPVAGYTLTLVRPN